MILSLQKNQVTPESTFFSSETCLVFGLHRKHYSRSFPEMQPVAICGSGLATFMKRAIHVQKDVPIHHEHISATDHAPGLFHSANSSWRASPPRTHHSQSTLAPQADMSRYERPPVAHAQYYFFNARHVRK